VERIVRFLECLVPVSICNLECEYCYLIQQNRRAMKNPPWDYDVKTVAKALSKKRLGGMAYISLCGEGETLVSNEVVELTMLLLQEGHAVNITTNGTISKKFDEILSFPSEYLQRLNFSFSLHYTELKKRNLLYTFFYNIEKVRKAGCSFVLQVNMCDSYMPYIDEIKKLAYERTGAWPQVALTRKEIYENNKSKYVIYTDKTEKEYVEAARRFESPLFECTLQNFNVKRKEFCYAGLWSGVLNLKTGILQRCYGTSGTNIFENVDKKIKFKPVGKHCPTEYCVNSSHFMSLGIIPEANVPTYAKLRNREEALWYNDTMKELLSHKFKDIHSEYTWVKKLRTEIDYFFEFIPKRIKSAVPQKIKRLIQKLLKR